MKSEAPISLRVLRLRKPEFFYPQTPYSESSDLLPYSPSPFFEPTSLSTFLMLPKDLGQIYVGETFRSYVSFFNTSPVTLKNVVLRVELVTQRQAQQQQQSQQNRISLLDTSATPVQYLSSQTHRGYVVEHTLTESGPHTLTCTVLYFDELLRETKNISKVFKFPVNHPLAIKNVKIYSLKDHVFVLLELQNITLATMLLESVAFLPHELSAFSLHRDHTPHSDDPASEVPMSSDEVRSFLFELARKKDGAATPELDKRLTPHYLGKFDIRWRMPYGEPGHLMTSLIEHPQVAKMDVEVEVVSCVDTVALEAPFDVVLDFHNHTDLEMDLILSLPAERMFPVAFNGSSVVPLGTCRGRSKVTHTLSLFALAPGLQPLSGLEVRDIRTGKAYSYNSVCSIFVKT